jgi:hypothetical protein
LVPPRWIFPSAFKISNKLLLVRLLLNKVPPPLPSTLVLVHACRLAAKALPIRAARTRRRPPLWHGIPSVHCLLMCRCSQMLDPPQSLHLLLMRWCSQMLDPPQSLHLFLCRWCSQMLDPPQSLHCLLCRWCSQMADPPQSLHLLLRRWCSQMADPPQTLHVAFRCWCSQGLPFFPPPGCSAGLRRPFAGRCYRNLSRSRYNSFRVPRISGGGPRLGRRSLGAACRALARAAAPGGKSRSDVGAGGE